ncbi:MAG: hypothetical protein H7831_09985 [Magnetococcus sp. WYHC-3]
MKKLKEEDKYLIKQFFMLSDISEVEIAQKFGVHQTAISHFKKSLEKSMPHPNLKHKCARCEQGFNNTVANYMLNGNYCPACSRIICQHLKDAKQRRANTRLANALKKCLMY